MFDKVNSSFFTSFCCYQAIFNAYFLFPRWIILIIDFTIESKHVVHTQAKNHIQLNPVIAIIFVANKMQNKIITTPFDMVWHPI